MDGVGNGMSGNHVRDTIECDEDVCHLYGAGRSAC